MDNYVYHDRKMMKWMPFNALLEQSDYLKELLNGKTRKEMPVLSPDQEADLNYKLEIANLFNSLILVSYFDEGDILEVEGRITRTDQFNKLVYINELAVSAYKITNIETI